MKLKYQPTSRSCIEYRKMLVRYLAASGRIAYVLNNRLICSSIFDFMDHLQVGINNSMFVWFDLFPHKMNSFPAG